jgi:hypothetical protein
MEIKHFILVGEGDQRRMINTLIEVRGLGMVWCEENKPVLLFLIEHASISE